MKNNYTFVSALALMLTLLLQQSFAQAVFTDNFNATPVAPIATTTSSTPTMTYTQTKALGGGGTNNNSAIIGFSAPYTSNYAQITDGTAAVTSGATYITGPLSKYSSPFDTVLSSNTTCIQWTFNAVNSRATTGFGHGLYGIAVVLAADGTDLTTANGYAVVYGGSGFRNYRLVAFTGGLDTTTNLTDIVNSGANDLAATTNYASIRVVYNPSNNQWQLFSRDDGATIWNDPTTGVTTQRGSTTVNSTYTSSHMRVFGFLWNYAKNANSTAQFDNFAVTLTSELTVSSTSLAFNNEAVGGSSSALSFNLSGTELTSAPGNITVTSSNTDFQVSSDNIIFSSTANIAYSTATLSATPVYVRFTPQAYGPRTGTLTFSGGGAISYLPTVALTGTGVNTFNWIGASGGTWATGTNWSPTGPPAANDAVTFYGTGTVTVTSVPSIALSSIKVGSGSTVTLDVGVLATSNTVTVSATGTDTSYAFYVASGGALTITGSSTANSNKNLILGFLGGSDKSLIAGTLSAGNTQGGTGNGEFLPLNSLTTVTGTLTALDNNSTITSTAADLTFANGATFQSLTNNLVIPLANWQPGSLCEIEWNGAAANYVAGDNLGQSFSNFTVNCPSTTGILQFNGLLTTVTGDLSVINTDGITHLLRLATNTAYTLTIGGQFNIGNATNNAEVDMSSTSASVTQVINVGGNFSISGTSKLIRTNANGEAIINFDAASGTQQITSTATGLTANRILFNVGTGSTINTVQLQSVFEMFTSDTLAVLGGSTLDCQANVVQGTTAGTTGNFILNSGANLLIGSAGGITSGAATTGNIQTNVRSFSATANYTYSGAVSQVTGNGLPTLNGNLTIDNTAATPTVTITTGVSITSNGTVYFNAGKLVMNGQTLTLNGAVSGGSSTVCIRGDAAATLNIGGSAGGSPGTLYIDNSSVANNEFANVTMDRTGTGPFVTIGTNISVATLLTLTSGVITSAATTDTVIIRNAAYTAIASTAPNTATYTLSWINGYLKRIFTIGSLNTYNFPVGTSTHSNLAAVLNNSLSGSTSYFTAWFAALATGGNNVDTRLDVWETSIGVSPYTPYTALNTAGSWRIEPDVQPTGGTYTISLYFNGFTVPPLVDNEFGIVKRPVSPGNDYADFKTGGGSINPTGLAGRLVTNGYALRMGLTSFSEFAIGQSGDVLPIQLTSFTAQKCDNNVDAILNWSTASEVNNNYFSIKAASSSALDNGELSFNEIGQVAGNGTTDIGHDYSFTDTRPGKSGDFYYRVDQVDLDGSQSSTNIQELTFDGNSAQLSASYPNPAANVLHLSIESSDVNPVTISVTNLIGQKVSTENVQLTKGGNLLDLNVESLPQGIYFINVENGSNLNLSTKFEKF